MTELKIHKRKVTVRVRLADQKTLNGQLYSSLLKQDGTPANVADRLNDPAEKFLPLAVEDKHYLVSKSQIVSVWLQDGEINAPAAEGVKSLPVQVTLVTGEEFEGSLYVYLPPARSRALDYLNGALQHFIPLWSGDCVTLINVDYLLGVTETAGVTES